MACYMYKAVKLSFTKAHGYVDTVHLNGKSQSVLILINSKETLTLPFFSHSQKFTRKSPVVKQVRASTRDLSQSIQ